MGTRSRIALELSDGNSFISAYHHWDGYPSWLGKILKEQYNTQEKVSELIDGGDMSCCWTNERWTDDMLERERQSWGPNYYSYRGEDLPPRLDNNLEELFSDSEEYTYIWRNGEWVCYNMNQFNDNPPEIVEIPDA